MATESDTLKDIRDDFTVDQEAWQPTVSEGDKDMLCVAGRVFEAMDPDGYRLRRDNKRPVISPDELSQHTNQVINGVRANKRAVKATAIGYGATDESAEFIQGKIRQIEYRSNAQRAYTTMFENAVQRSYGFCRIIARHLDEDPQPDPQTGALALSAMDQELLIQSIENPNTVTPDANSVKPDGSDMKRCTITESLGKAEFKRKYKDAKIVDFGAFASEAPGWLSEDKVLVGEHWRIESDDKKLLVVDRSQPDGTRARHALYEDDWATLKARGVRGEVKRTRTVSTPRVVQYLTNGIELLGDPLPWPGKYIPVVQCLGKVLWITEGGVSKRTILSLIRLARDPAMFYAYVRSCEAESIGSVPRASVIGYKGQFQGFENDWQRANHEPVAFLEVNGNVEGINSGGQMLPLPQFHSWDPPLMNLEAAAESGRRMIQAAIGTTPLPTAAQRQNEKSGIALNRITQTMQQGQFHLVDNFDDSLCRCGVILEDLIPHYYDTARDEVVRNQDDTTQTVRINDPTSEKPLMISKGGKGVGLHDITISTGPSYDSEREASIDFANNLLGNQQVAQIIGPQKATQVLALAVKLQNVGPLGDQIADIISPPPPKDGQGPDPAQIQQHLQMAQQVIQAGAQHIQQLEQDVKNQTAKAQIDRDTKLALADKDIDFQKWKMERDSETKITVAELGAKVDRLTLFLEERQRLGLQAHEADQAQRDRQHDVGMAAMSHVHATDQQQAQADAGMAAQTQQQQAQAEQAAQAAEQQPGSGSGTTGGQ